MLVPDSRMPLAGHACLATASVEQARDHLSAMFWPHRLHLHGGERGVAFRHNRASCGALSVNALSYGREIAINVAPSDHAFLVKFTLAGHSELLQDGARVVSTAGMVCVMNPGSRFKVHLSADHNQLTLRVDGARLQRFLEAELGYRPRLPLSFHGLARNCRGDTPGLARMVKTLCDDLEDQSVGFVHGVVVRHLEETLYSLLLTELPHNYSTQLVDTTAGAPRVVARVRDFIATHARQALTLHDLAGVAGISARALQQAFRQHLGTTPMAYLRDQRLALARAQMCSDRHLPVTQVALACGFTHLSRFARYYRERFGETPHATRQR